VLAHGLPQNTWSRPSPGAGWRLPKTRARCGSVLWAAVCWCTAVDKTLDRDRVLREGEGRRREARRGSDNPLDGRVVRRVRRDTW